MRAIVAMIGAALAALFFVMGGCGGGGAASSNSPAASTTLPATLRTDALFCYWYMDQQAALETTDHTNCVMAGESYVAPLAQLAALSQAAGRNVILAVPACEVPLAQVESEVRFWLRRIADAGYLKNIVAVYPCDEPDDKGFSDADMRAIITATHAAMATFDETRAKPIAMFYTCGGKARPGLAFVDWPGCDRYDHGCAVFVEAYGEFEAMAAKEPDVHPLAIAGGSDPWRQQPACWEAKVQGDPRYAGLLVFIYQTTTDRGVTYTGVRDNGLRPAWCGAGRRFLTGDPAAHC